MPELTNTANATPHR